MTHKLDQYIINIGITTGLIGISLAVIAAWIWIASNMPEISFP